MDRRAINVTCTEHKNLVTILKNSDSRNPDFIWVFYVGPEVIVIHVVARSSQPRIRVPGSSFLMWPGSNRHDHSSSSHHDLENRQDDKAKLWGRSKVIVWIWTFRGTEKESESEGGELSILWSVPPVT